MPDVLYLLLTVLLIAGLTALATLGDPDRRPRADRDGIDR